MTINIRKMNWFVRLITLNWPDAITIMPFGIFIKDEYLNDNTTLNHETIHALQQKEMFILFFYVWYLIEWLIRLVINYKMAYMSVSFEREAYRNDDVMNYLSNRKPFAWLSYLRQDRRFNKLNTAGTAGIKACGDMSKDTCAAHEDHESLAHG